MDAFARGGVAALAQRDVPVKEIAKLVRKKDGTRPSVEAVRVAARASHDDPLWRGEDSRAGGRPCELTDKEFKQLVKLVFAERGKAVVTAPYCQKRLPFLRQVCAQTVRNYLHKAGLLWLRRRRKTAVPKEHRASRARFCRWLKRQRRSYLGKFAYTDGTTFYLARGPAEVSHKRRAALGPCVYRMASGKDGLWDDNVGPSLYARSQGLPVKIWGLFANCLLHYYVLPKDGRRTTNMNGARYNKLVNTKFASWRRQSFPRTAAPLPLVQDHERCLWAKQNVDALRAAGFSVVKQFPKHSPDLNAIEGWWHRLKVRLDATAPSECETRAEFLRRLHRTVQWLNRSARSDGRRLCTNQKQRAADVLKLRGAKSKW